MKKITTGIVAHVDAGKTTLSEGMLFTSGSIRKMGRVDNQDAFLDTDQLERARGITIFSKQARLEWEDTAMTLLDTPGHVDFSAEMERTLQVLDYAILVISGADGVQGHTMTLWRLLERYQIPTFLFINKMDQPGTDVLLRLQELQQRLDGGCILFGKEKNADFEEEIAMCEEELLEQFLETGTVEAGEIQRLIWERKVFPCFFGSALKLDGVEELMHGIAEYTVEADYKDEFGAKIYKIARDEQGNRLSYLKVTGGTLKVKANLTNRRGKDSPQTDADWEEKVNQIRLYSGEKYESVNEVEAGMVCAVTGLTKTYPGQGLGIEAETGMPVLEPVLTYQIILPEKIDAAQMLPKLRQLEEEDPELHIVWNEKLQEILVQIMGEVQIEILKSLIFDRFGVEVTFGTGNIVYKETIANVVEGVGHFEPLRHYAEVHLLLEPGEPGSGIQLFSDCSEDLLDRNWQRLILTHLEEKEHVGVLTGAALTDVQITLVGGRAHQKHTEGGDFRQATYRAVRQGLMQAESVLLEPYYQFRLELPTESIGRAMTDIEKMSGVFETPLTEGELSILSGSVPVSSMRDYQKDVIAYTRGKGKLFCTLKGYGPCHNAKEVIEKIGYDAERDLLHTPDSVFCAHGAGFIVPWYDVKDHMHVESFFSKKKETDTDDIVIQRAKRETQQEELWIGTAEIDSILAKTFDANRRNKSLPKKGYKSSRYRLPAKEMTYTPSFTRTFHKTTPVEEYLLVDGYNVIFAWEELSEIAKVNIDGARGRLLDIMCNYQGIKKCNLIVVFDAYRVEGHDTEISDYHNIHVVFTKEAETADAYIEKFAHENAGKYKITVATSDGLEQIIIRGAGCLLISSRELEKEVRVATDRIVAEYQHTVEKKKNSILDQLPEEKRSDIIKYINRND